MRREPWFAVGLLLAAIAELQWASTFYAGDDPLGLVLAAILFLAACGFLLGAGGILLRQGSWTWHTGLAVAAGAHVAYLFATLSWGVSVLTLASALAAIGLGTAAWGGRSERVNLVRGGLFAAALGGAVWTIADTMAGDMSYMVGNVFAMIGWGVAAGFAPDPQP